MQDGCMHAGHHARQDACSHTRPLQGPAHPRHADHSLPTLRALLFQNAKPGPGRGAEGRVGMWAGGCGRRVRGSARAKNSKSRAQHACSLVLRCFTDSYTAHTRTHTRARARIHARTHAAHQTDHWLMSVTFLSPPSSRDDPHSRAVGTRRPTRRGHWMA